MPYVDPMDTYSDGDLVPTADINQWISNIDYLHSRPITITVPGVNSGSHEIQGDYAANQIANTGAGTADTVFMLAVPDNFDTLVSCQIVIFSTTTYTAEYDIGTDYGTPDAGSPEDYNQHSGSIPNTTIALTANKLKYIDVSSAITSLAGGDVLAVRILNSTGANAGSWYAPMMKLVYTASDTVP